MREGQLCLVMFVVVPVENVSTDSFSFWVADLAQVSITKIYANTINVFQLVGVEMSGMQGCVHERSKVSGEY